MATAGHPKFTHGGSDTGEVSAPVAKGQGLETDPADKKKWRPWSALSVTRQGVAMISAAPLSTNLAGNMAPARRHVSVARAPKVVKMVFATACDDGDEVVAAANGAVAKPGSTPAANTVVGICRGTPAGHGSVVANQIGIVELT